MIKAGGSIRANLNMQLLAGKEIWNYNMLGNFVQLRLKNKELSKHREA